MKLIKMSLVAAMLVGSSAFAIDNVKVSGNANLFYATSDSHGDKDLFVNHTSTMGQASLGLGATADLTKGVSAGTHLTALSTLGLEGQLVGNVWEGTNGVSDSFWFDEAWMATTAGKTTVKIGRQALDTPLVFSEDWSVATNTFEAAVVINQNLPSTTIVGAYVGGSNGGDLTGVVVAPMNANGTTNFSQFYNGAFALGVVNNSVEALTAQLWYYDATRVITALWGQADLSLGDISIGGQYTSQTLNGGDAQTAMAVKVGYEIKDTLKLKAAYSMVDDTVGLGQVGGNLSGSGQSKLYTEAWWSYGYVTKSDNTAITVEAEYEAHGIADLGVFYTMVENGAAAKAGDLTELALTASRSYGPLDTTLAVYTEEADGKDATTGLQVYLTYNF